jgi:hypothetical protein
VCKTSRGLIDFLTICVSPYAVNSKQHTFTHMAKTAALSYRVPEELKAELQKLADADRRKLGQYIQLVLEAHVESRRAGLAAAQKRGKK